MRAPLTGFLLAALAAVPAAAQQPHQPPHQGGMPGEQHHAGMPAAHDPLEHFLFPPELVLQHAQDLGLEASQRTAIVNAIKEAQGDLLDLQLQLADRSQDLQNAISEPKVDEGAALAAIDRVLSVERDIKRKQLQLLIRIRNTLTPEQHEKLKALHKRMMDEHEQ